MINEKEKKCINPWFGFLAIILTCIILAGAIAFGYRNSGRKNRRQKTGANNAAMRAGFVKDIYPASKEMIIF